MAKDDYHVLVCIILEYLYKCLKKGKCPNLDAVDNKALHIPYSYWGYIMKYLQQDGYVDGVKIAQCKDGLIMNADSIEITPKGIDYLENNSNMEKARKVIKETGGFLQGLITMLGLFN